jgi:hypothetical protein
MAAAGADRAVASQTRRAARGATLPARSAAGRTSSAGAHPLQMPPLFPLRSSRASVTLAAGGFE